MRDPVPRPHPDLEIEGVARPEAEGLSNQKANQEKEAYLVYSPSLLYDVPWVSLAYLSLAKTAAHGARRASSVLACLSFTRA